MAPNVKTLYVTRQQAAWTLSCSTQLIDKMIRTGRLPAFYVGRSVRVKIEDLERVVEVYNISAPKGAQR